ncbi:Glyoxalase/Bleomycin resistance protein/Dioxygenase superfamily protein [Anaerobranca californiensis DSM 14826]|jgi:catechol 2,3-dioxygenase-like lactoylglutathione lyase family enzyme|uniref:Glyoxalase/Bleomycin resistance protein/Dioxygenase superfamily protein n=1 Tax=Anaerobranca californiensis DSM 14826 TaxID=1120989 RepID=A0A1M6LIZ5_9FIRM|nr:VOC family protein [Anaerobranca californiensis]SHJ71155.1 Glyoxalase/Bleomycin resistance protein/Dioxygenase superfamily protein [Anaerobranca californiensis DSM 14826]
MNYQGLIVFLGTNNLEKTHYFYHEILQLPLYKDQGVCKIYDVPGGGKIGFCQHMDISINGKSPIITLLVDDVDKSYKELLEKNVIVEEKPKINPKFNIYHFFVKDPNGYNVEIQKFL